VLVCRCCAATVVLQFPLSQSRSDVLELTTADCSRVGRIVALTKLNTVEAERLHTLFNTQTRDGQLDKPGFDRCIRKLVPGNQLTQDDKRCVDCDVWFGTRCARRVLIWCGDRYCDGVCCVLSFLSVTLATLFYAFRTESGSSFVSFEQFSTGFSVLAGGTKSDKLSAGFRLFDDDEDGSLNRKQLYLFVRSFLTVLFYLQSSITEVSAVRDCIDRTATETTGTCRCRALCAHCGSFAPACDGAPERSWLLVLCAAEGIFRLSTRRDAELISYEEFGNWYNKGGYTVSPWLELLDLKKWPGLNISSAVAAAPATEASTNDSDAEELEDEDEEDTSTAEFTFSMAPGTNLVLNSVSFSRFRELLNRSKLDTINAGRVHTTLLAASSNGGTRALCDRRLRCRACEYWTSLHVACAPRGFFAAVLVKSAFEAALRRLLDGVDIASATRGLNILFRAFDRNDDGRTDVAEVAAGFSILAAGSKSDKLSLAFKLFDDDDDGHLSKLELWKFLRAFLTVLATLAIDADSALSVPTINKAAITLTQVRSLLCPRGRCDRMCALECWLCFECAQPVAPWCSRRCRRSSAKPTPPTARRFRTKSSARGTTAAASLLCRGWSCST
jgi:Ca2+-binding EF-hand superfamily protein